MEALGRRLPSKETVLRVLQNLFLHEKFKKPLATAFYVNDSCNAQCDFCSQKEHLRGENRAEQADLETQLEILRAIRQDVSNIYLMGGEPSIHPHLAELLQACEDLEFDTIAINTNAVVYRPEILGHANMLVVSLFSTDPLKLGASLYPNLNPDQQMKIGQRVLDNVRRYAQELDPEKTTMIINKVVTGEEGDISGVYDIVNLCRELGAKLNIAPAIMLDNKPDPRLAQSLSWIFLINFLRTQNMDIMSGSSAYLKTIMNFERFDCTPNAIPAVRQNGDMDVPCPNVSEPKVVNLLQAGGVMAALNQGREEFGQFEPAQDCDKICHKTCYVEAANLAKSGFAIEAIRGIFRKRADRTMENGGDSFVSALVEFFMEDVHDFDTPMQAFGDVAQTNAAFTVLIEELSDEELAQLNQQFCDIYEQYEMLWEYLYTGGYKVLAITSDIVNQIFTRPFAKFFRGVRRLTGVPVISDMTGGRAMNRITFYRQIIGNECTKRVRKLQVA